ncbi:MAG: GH116 family glycosyl-hydrolase, partial [Gemmatimonadales bacterium]
MSDHSDSDEHDPRAGDSCCGPDCCNNKLDRRTFIQLAGAGAAAVSGMSYLTACAGPFSRKDTVDHFIPIDKKLSSEWVASLFERGDRTWYSGQELETVGMPVGGICAGQVYLTGDGRLRIIDIFNQYANSGYGAVNYREGRTATQMVVNTGEIIEAPSLDQGFAIEVETGGNKLVRTIDASGFPNVRFCGEYPIGTVEYVDSDFPVAVELEAFSPFIPLNAADSALPATVLAYSLRNTSAEAVRVTLAGWFENAVCYHTDQEAGVSAHRRNSVIRSEGITTVMGSARLEEDPLPPNYRPPTVFADFEGDSYGDWTIEGDAFGSSPAAGTLPDQQAVTGFQGEKLVNTFLEGDATTGKLTSPEFTIERPWISFLIGGGAHSEQTCINLIVDESVVRTASGSNNEQLLPHNWDVSDLAGRTARIEIVDAVTTGWGHINVDQIEFRDVPMRRDLGDLNLRPDIGTMALTVLGAGTALSSPVLPTGTMPGALFATEGLQTAQPQDLSSDGALRGAVGRTLDLAPGETAEVTFVFAWHMPNLYFRDSKVGNFYAGRFGNATDVVRYVAANRDRLSGDTQLWHDTWYGSTLPWWLLFRIHSTAANLATA